MNFHYAPYVWVLMASGIITVILGVYTWRHRAVRGALPFFVSMMIVTLWCWGNALEMANTGLPAKLFWANVQYVAYAFAPVALLVMVGIFTNNEKWFSKRNITFLCIIPILTIMLVWSNELHGLIRQEVFLDESGIFPVVGKNYGPWFWVHSFYSYLLNLTAILLLIKNLGHKSLLYREQIKMILIGTLFIVLPNLLYILGLSPIDNFDVTPVFIAVAGCIIAWGLFRYRLFDVTPVAREMIIDSISGAVVVLDEQQRVLELNPAAESLMDLEAARVLGKRAEEVAVLLQETLDILREKDDLNGYLELVKDSHYYQVNYSSLIDQKGQLMGKLLIIYNITEVRETQQRLMEQQRDLAVFAERERLARDLHDNIAQILGFINIQAQAMQQELSKCNLSQVDHGLERISQVAQDAHTDVREYIQNIREDTSIDVDFLNYLQNYLERFATNYDIKVKLNIDPHFLEQLSPYIRVHLFRIIQEALANVRKHAQTSFVNISGVGNHNRLMLVIEDQGRGFDVRMIPQIKGTGFGLKIMEERAQEVGAIFSIESQPNQGTKVTVELPLAP